MGCKCSDKRDGVVVVPNAPLPGKPLLNMSTIEREPFLNRHLETSYQDADTSSKATSYPRSIELADEAKPLPCIPRKSDNEHTTLLCIPRSLPRRVEDPRLPFACIPSRFEPRERNESASMSPHALKQTQTPSPPLIVSKSLTLVAPTNFQISTPKLRASSDAERQTSQSQQPIRTCQETLITFTSKKEESSSTTNGVGSKHEATKTSVASIDDDKAASQHTVEAVTALSPEGETSIEELTLPASADSEESKDSFSIQASTTEVPEKNEREDSIVLKYATSAQAPWLGSTSSSEKDTGTNVKIDSGGDCDVTLSEQLNVELDNTGLSEAVLAEEDVLKGVKHEGKRVDESEIWSSVPEKIEAINDTFSLWLNPAYSLSRALAVTWDQQPAQDQTPHQEHGDEPAGQRAMDREIQGTGIELCSPVRSPPSCDEALKCEGRRENVSGCSLSQEKMENTVDKATCGSSEKEVNVNNSDITKNGSNSDNYDLWLNPSNSLSRALAVTWEDQPSQDQAFGDHKARKRVMDGEVPEGGKELFSLVQSSADYINKAMSCDVTAEVVEGSIVAVEKPVEDKAKELENERIIELAVESLIEHEPIGKSHESYESELPGNSKGTSPVRESCNDEQGIVLGKDVKTENFVCIEYAHSQHGVRDVEGMVKSTADEELRDSSEVLKWKHTYPMPESTDCQMKLVVENQTPAASNYEAAEDEVLLTEENKKENRDTNEYSDPPGAIENTIERVVTKSIERAVDQLVEPGSDISKLQSDHRRRTPQISDLGAHNGSITLMSPEEDGITTEQLCKEVRQEPLLANANNFSQQSEDPGVMPEDNEECMEGQVATSVVGSRLEIVVRGEGVVTIPLSQRENQKEPKRKYKFPRPLDGPKRKSTMKLVGTTNNGSTEDERTLYAKHVLEAKWRE